MAGKCGNHRPYRSRAEARAVLSWHLMATCRKCQSGKVFNAWPCQPSLQHWHVGHINRESLSPAQAAIMLMV